MGCKIYAVIEYSNTLISNEIILKRITTNSMILNLRLKNNAKYNKGQNSVCFKSNSFLLYFLLPCSTPFTFPRSFVFNIFQP